MHTLFFTLGFDEKFILRWLTKLPLTEKDQIVLLTAHPLNPKVQEAKRSIDLFLLKSTPIQTKLYPIKLEDFTQAVKQIKQIIAKHAQQAKQVKFILSGGMRALILATYTAIILSQKILKEKQKQIIVDLENLEGYIQLPDITKVIKPVQLTKEKIEILQLIENQPLTAKQITNKLNKDTSTIY
ncbi:MAG: hypothetical protein DRJ63_03100, partial [Thermoprotei archaeon]